MQWLFELYATGYRNAITKAAIYVQIVRIYLYVYTYIHRDLYTVLVHIYKRTNEERSMQ